MSPPETYFECKKHGKVKASFYSKTRFRCSVCKLESDLKRRKINKKKAVEYKGGKCSVCNFQSECLDVYDFHHLDPKIKDFKISTIRTRTWERIKFELDKCILVCANCHRIIHSKNNNGI